MTELAASSRRARIEAICLGPVAIVVDGIPLDLRDDQRVTLAALIALGPSGGSKSQFYNQLFDGRAQRSGAQAAVMRVRRLRTKLTQAGAPPEVFYAGARFGVDNDYCEVDAWTFERQLSSGNQRDLVDALMRWREPYDDLPDDPHLVTIARAQLRNLYKASLARLGTEAEVASVQALLPAVLDAVAKDPVDERLAASAAITLYRLGRQTEALDVIRVCRSHLVDHFGLSTGPDLDKTELAILHHRLSDLVTLTGETANFEVPDPTRGPSTVTAGNRSWTTLNRRRAARTVIPEGGDRFIGRGALLDRLKTSLNKTASFDRSEPGRIHLLEGASGSGKTSVVAQVRNLLNPAIDFRYGSAPPRDRRPYGVLIQAVPEIAEQLEELTTTQSANVNQLSIYRSIHQRVVEALREAPTVVALDDMQWADPHSVGFLTHYVDVARPSTLSMVVAATHRQRESGSNSPWYDALPILQSAKGLEHHELEAFNLDELVELVELDHPAHSPISQRAFASRLAYLTLGVPLMAAVLSRDSGPNNIERLNLLAVSPEDRLTQHLASRVPDQQVEQMLSAAALFGLRFDAEKLAALTSTNVSEVEAILQRGAERHFCRRLGASSWRFDNHLTMNYFDSRLGFMRPILFARMAERSPTSDPQIVRYVIGATGEIAPKRAIELLRQASDDLESQQALPEAAEALEHLIQLLEASPPVDSLTGDNKLVSRGDNAIGSEVIDLLLRLSNCLCRTGALEAARVARGDAYRRARSVGDKRRMFEAAVAGLPVGEYAGGDADRLEMLRELFADETDHEIPGVAPAALLRWLLRQERLCGDVDRAVAGLSSIDPLWREHDAVAWQTIQLEILAIDETALARPAFDAAIDLAESIKSDVLRAEALAIAAIYALIEQRRSDFEETFTRALAEARRSGSIRVQWHLQLTEASVASAGFGGYSLSIDHPYRFGSKWHIPDAFEAWTVQMVMNRWLSNDLGSLASLIVEMDEPGLPMAGASHWGAAEALVMAAAGRLDEAGVLGNSVAQEIKDRPTGIWAPITAGLLVEVAQRVGDPSLAKTGAAVLAPRSGQALVLGMGAAYLGPVDRYLGVAAELDSTSTGLDYLESAVEQAASSGSNAWHKIAAQSLKQAQGEVPPFNTT